jgi:diguanylate cyclase (GGDEF)-like protein
MVPDPLAVPEISEVQRLEQCVREPIRTPGRIQSHGILFASNRTGHIDVVSENAATWLGHSVAELGSPSLEWCVASGAHADPIQVEVDGEEYDAIVHEIGDRVIVELESRSSRADLRSTSVIGAIQRFGQASTAEELRQSAAEEVRTITGFDRVMVYRFFDDGHGEVAGESADAEMESYRGLHFPASDIPQQARSLYITKLSRAIAGTADPGLSLLAADPGGEPLDLSCAELRAVSPHHLEFMRNMGQESTVSFSLVHDGRLIGMITCAHRTTRRIPVLLRRALEALASQLTLQIVALESIARLRRELDARERRRVLLTPVSGAAEPLEALLSADESLLRLVSADGAIICIDGISKSVGEIPHTDRSALLDAVGIEPLATDALPTTHPGLAGLMPGVGGLLVVPVGTHGVVIFLRREVTQVIRWLGDQSDDNRDTPLSPRRSFSAWSQSVSGTALPWGVLAEEARTFGREFAEALDRRVEVRLAGLALIDPLTGLQNRRSLLDRLERAVAEGRDGCLLFLDLDRFKSINDRWGHEAGDVVLRTVATRLVSISRETDTVARLGGDEFVVLCLDVSPPLQTGVAERIVEAVGRPVALGGDTELAVTVSCGVVPLGTQQTPGALLDAADAAMYRAKNDGRNRASR